MTVDLNRAIPESAIEALFTDAHTTYAFDGKPVPQALLEQVVDLSKLGPTALNSHPLRVHFVTGEAKNRLLPALNDGNRAKSDSASVVAILAYDADFHEHLPVTTPHMPQAPAMFAANEAMRLGFARDNAWLQAGYFIMAARALGLYTGPMGGMDHAAVDDAFFAGTSWRSIFVVNLGYAADVDGAQRPRTARLDLTTIATFED